LEETQRLHRFRDEVKKQQTLEQENPNHYDHMDIPTLRRLNSRHRPLIVTPLGNDTILTRAIPGTLRDISLGKNRGDSTPRVPHPIFTFPIRLLRVSRPSFAWAGILTITRHRQNPIPLSCPNFMPWALKKIGRDRAAVDSTKAAARGSCFHITDAAQTKKNRPSSAWTGHPRK
jgi:hypothetical protein